MNFVYVLTMTYNSASIPEIYTDYEEAKKSFFLSIREDILGNIIDPTALNRELTKLNDFIEHFEDEKLGERVSIKAFTIEGEESTFYTLMVKRINKPSCRIMVFAWDGEVGWSPLTCEAFVLCRDKDEVENMVSFNAELWSEQIIPAGLKVIKTEGFYDEESDEDPVTRVMGDWLIIRGDVYLTDEELVTKLKELGIIEFANCYGV